jgi:high affinity Mn2+ porin
MKSTKTKTFIKGAILILMLINLKTALAQDSIKTKRFTLHYQFTTVYQFKAGFKPKYTDSGSKSVIPKAEEALSITTTLFAGARLWKNATFILNPEIAGGAGISKAVGLGGFVNGETFRIGDPAPKLYVARLFIRQLIPIGKEKKDVFVADDFNQIAQKEPEKAIGITLGKFSLSDYFDCKVTNHDPRTQFLNWALMSAGAWDYPANTRGYTYALMLEYLSPKWSFRAANSLVPEQANGPYLDIHFPKAYGLTVEAEKNYSLNNQKGNIHFTLFYNKANMGNYKKALEQMPVNPDITLTRRYKHTKAGFIIALEQDLSKSITMTSRLSYNDGKNETWAFTEIDQSLSLSFVANNHLLKTKRDDHLGFAVVTNGISKQHQNYLKAGGQGFMLGDGQLNYAPEFITELYYSLNLKANNLWISPDIQYVVNPGYNQDRKSFLVSGIRAHIEF